MKLAFVRVMKLADETRSSAIQPATVTPPLTLGLGDFAAILLSGLLMVVAVLWPRASRSV